MRLVLISTVAALAAAGCASNTVNQTRYQEELQELREECTARGGVLQAISNSQGAHARADYACRMQDVSPSQR